MDALFFFVLWGAALFLMMRYGCGAHVMGDAGSRSHGSGSDTDQSELRWIAPKKDTDPVCGETVLTQSAKPSVYDGRVFYFCSRECREVFEAAPDLYAGAERNNGGLAEQGHG